MEKFTSPCPPPTPFEAEVLEILIEECAEVIQRATKMLRFGVREAQPGQPRDNAYRLGGEVGDLLEVIDLALRANLIDPAGEEAGRVSKRRKLAIFMQNVEPQQ